MHAPKEQTHDDGHHRICNQKYREQSLRGKAAAHLPDVLKAHTAFVA